MTCASSGVMTSRRITARHREGAVRVSTARGRTSLRIVSGGERIRRLLLRPEPAALAATVLLTAVFSSLSPIFLTTETLVSIASVASELGIVAVGMTLLMIGGHFDLSVGAIVGLT